VTTASGGGAPVAPVPLAAAVSEALVSWPGAAGEGTSDMTAHDMEASTAADSTLNAVR